MLIICAILLIPRALLLIYSSQICIEPLQLHRVRKEMEISFIAYSRHPCRVPFLNRKKVRYRYLAKEFLGR